MPTAKQDKTRKNGLTVKDLIVMGVFGALLMVCSMIGGVLFAVTPTLTFYFSIGAALLPGPVFLLLLAKVPKRWGLTIIGVIISLLSLIMGMHWGMCVGGLIGAFLADMIAGTKNYRSKKLNILAYIVYSFGPMGTYIAYFVDPEGWASTMLQNIADRIVYLADGKIEKIYTPQEFRSLSGATRKHMGLRTTDIQDVHPISYQRTFSRPILTVKDVSLFYKKHPVLEHISLQASKGDIIGVVGPNGAGKTTFLRTLCGLHKEFTGCFYWREQPQKETERMKRSYMVMQDVNYELFADSVEAECSFGIQGSSPELVEKNLDELGLLTVRDRHPNTLSGGQKQRVAVAVSMICGKEVLVFDEPTSGLDYDSMEQVSGLIRELSKDKVIFVVTHDYEFVCQTCTRLIRFDHHTMTNDILLSQENEATILSLMGLGRDER